MYLIDALALIFYIIYVAVCFVLGEKQELLSDI